ncbi:MAG: putative transcriptional regulator [Haloquadratum sp. J07HQX50]|nr:MAG: putative transcriptional regulator [Haloquadratum sp. J07HQX50]
MVDRELTSQLQELGLTKYQSEAYIAAVQAGEARPTDLVDISGVPQGRIYDVIDDLAKMGLIEVRSHGQGKSITAPSPEPVLEELKHRRIDDISQRIDAVSRGLDNLYEETDAETDGYVTMVSRQETALRHIRQAIDAAECWLILSVPLRMYQEIKVEVAAAVKEGVTVRLLLSGTEDPPELTFPERLAVHFRAVADTFVAADRTYGIYASDHPHKESRSYLITQEATLVLLLQDYTETIWTASARIQDGASLPKCYLDPRRVLIEHRTALDNGEALVATVSGHRTGAQREDTWSGYIVDYELSGPVKADYDVAPPTIASFTLATEDGEITVGGWRATVEDVAATAIELTRQS